MVEVRKINGLDCGSRTGAGAKRWGVLLTSTALGCTLLAANATAQTVSQTSATGDPITINSTTAVATDPGVDAIYAETDGTIAVTSQSASASGFEASGIHAQGGAGAVTIDSTTATSSGSGGPAILATTTSGDISVTSGTATQTSTVYDDTWWTGDGIVAASDTGNVSIISGTAHSDALYGSAIVGLGGTVSIVSDQATTTGDDGAALYGSASGNVTIQSNNITTGGTGAAVNALAGGVANVTSGTITGSGNLGAGIYAEGATGATISTGAIDTDGYALLARGGDGDVSITATGPITSRSGSAIRVNNTVGNVTVESGAVSAGNLGVSVETAGDIDIDSGTVETSGDLGTGIRAVTGGAINIASDAVTVTGPGADPGFDPVTTFRLAQGGIVAQGGENAIVIDSGSVSVDGDYRYGIFASGNGAITISSDTLDYDAVDSAGISVVGGAGAVNVDSGTLTANGSSGAGVVVRTTSGAINIVADQTHANGTGIFGPYTADAVVGLSDTGAVTISSNSASSDGYAGSAVAAIGSSVTITSGAAAATGDYGAIVYASALNGNTAVTSGTITSTGLSTNALAARAVGGSVTVNSGTITSTGAGAMGLFARGDNGVDVTSGAIEGDGYGIVAGSVNGNVAIAATGSITSHSSSGIRVNNTLGDVSVQATDVAAGMHGIDVATSGDVTIDSGTVTVEAGGGYGIHAATNGAITIDSGSVTTAAGEYEGGQNAAIFAAGGEGAINISSGTILTSGAGTSGVYATSTSGDISITAEDSRSTATDLGPNFVYNDVLVGISETGDVTIDSGYTESASLYGSGIVGIGNNVLIASDNSVASGNGGVAIYGSGSASVTIHSNTVTTTGDGAAINAMAADGTVNVTSGTISSLNGSGIYASGFLGTNVTAGAVATKHTAISLESDGGDIALTTTGAVSSSEYSAVYLGAAGTSTVVVDAASTLTAGKIGVFAERGTLHLTNAGTIRSNGTYDGVDEAPHAGVTISQGDAIVTNSGTISGAGFGITTAHYYNPETDLLEPLATGTSVINSGTIRGDNNDGIRLIGGGTVTNSGTIEGLVGQFADGISMFALNGQDTTGDTEIGSVANAAGGMIAGARFGILQTGGGTVTNAGTISGGLASIRIQEVVAGQPRVADVNNSGTLIGGIGIGPNIASSTIVNSGTITTGGFSHGIDVHADAVAIDNSGTITATGGMFGVAAYSFGSLAMENSGTISGADGVEAVAGGETLSFVNSGTITGTGNEGGDELHGVTLIAGYDPVTFEPTRDADTASFANSGTITGEITLDFAALSGSFVNSGTITGQPGDSVVDFNVYRIDGGDAASATFDNSGTLNGAIEGELNATSVVFTNSGTITATGSGEDGEAALDIENDSLASNSVSFTNASGGAITSTGPSSIGAIVSSSVSDEAGESIVSVVNAGTIVANGGGQSVDVTEWGIEGVDTMLTLGGGMGIVALAPQSEASLVNSGVIEAIGPMSLALYAEAGHFSLTNTGRITGTDGTAFTASTIDGGDLTVIHDLLEVGKIRVAGAIQTLDSIDTITNSGTITGSIDLDSGDDLLINSGTIDGDVEMGLGDDGVGLATGTSVTGVIDGGEGTDAMELAGTSATLSSAQTVAASRNFEELLVSSGYWTASAGSSEFGLVGIAAGATLDVHEVAVGGSPSSAIITEVVHNDGLLVLNFDSDELADIETLAITGSGGVRLDGEAAFTVDEETMGFTGTAIIANGSLTLAGTGALSGDVATSGDGAFVLGDGGTTGTFTGDLVNNGVFVFNRTDDYDFMGAFSGTGDFTKLGGGTLTFAGDYSYTGTTTIGGGSVKFAGQLDPETEIDLESGTLDISGTPQTIAQLSGGETAGINVQSSQLTVNQTTNTAFAGAISGDGGLVKSGTGLLNLTGTSTYTGNTVVNGGALAVNGSIASTVVVNPGGTLKGVGSIGGATITSSGTAAPGNSIGTLNVAGDISFAAGSTYEVEVNAAGESDRIVATGEATLTGGTVQVLAADGNYAPLTEYTIITAAGGVDGTFDTVTSNLAFLTPTLTYGATTVGLELLRNDIDFSAVASTDNQRSTADALQALGARNTLFEAIVVQDAANARSAYDALSGEIYASVPSALVNDSRHVRDALLGAGRVAGEGNSIWGQALGSWGGADDSNGLAELDTNHKGAMAGVNFGREDISGGIGAGFSKADYDMRDRGSNAEADSKFVGAHIGFDEGPLGFRFGGAYAWHNIAASRTVSFPGVTEAPESSYDATTRQLFGEASYNIAYGPASVAPFARLASIRTSTDGFEESDGEAALTLDRDVRDVQLLSLGVRASTVSAISETATIEPRAAIAWQHGWGDLGGRSTAAFAGGAGFDVLGSRLPEDAADLDIGFDIRSGNFRIGASYRGLVSSRWSDHGAQVTLGFDF